MGLILLNSRGLNTKIGAKQICDELCKQNVNDLTEKSILVVSYPEYEVNDAILDNCINILGLRKENIIFTDYHYLDKHLKPDIIYVTEGNTFEVLHYMRKYDIPYFIQSCVCNNSDCIYIGSSAGAIIAGTDIKVAIDFDRNFVGMNDFTGLNLFDGTIIPHFTKQNFDEYMSRNRNRLMSRYNNVYSVSNEEVITINN